MSDPQDLTARYQLKQLLNWTGSARTFRGSHPSSGEPVAVKLLSISRAPGAFELGRRFENMGRVLQALSHPSLPRIVEFGLTSTGDGFLVTRWVDGTPLADDRPMAPAELLPLLLQVIEALETVTLHGVAHLNITPDNLLLQKDGVVRILGWGTSLLTVDWKISQEEKVDTGPANPWGAPELLRQVTPGEALWRADLYSVALIATRLLGARLEDRSASAPGVRFDKGLSGQLKQPEKLRAQLELCLRRDPAQRPDTFAELARAIQHALPRGAAALDTQPVEKIEKPGPSGAATAAEMDLDRATTVLPKPEPPPPVPSGPDPDSGEGEPSEVLGAGGRDRRVVLAAASADVTGVRAPAPEPPPAAATPPKAPPSPGPRPPSSSQPKAAAAPPATPARPTAPPTPRPPTARPTAPPTPRSQPAPTGPGSASADRAKRANAPVRPSAPSAPKTAESTPAKGLPDRTSPLPVAPAPSADAAKPGAGGSNRTVLWLAGGAVVLLLVAGVAIGAVWWLFTRESGTREVAVEQTTPEVATPELDEMPEEAPPVPLPELLEQALLEIADGELLQARSTLEELSDLEEAGELPSEVSLAYYSVLETLRRSRAEEVVEQLRGGLRRYDLALLDRSLRAMNGEEERLVAADAAGRRLLNRARAVLSTAGSLEEAIREGRLVEALEGANRLEQDDPELSAALDVRVRAAEKMEEQIDQLIAADRMEQADRQLRELERLWPGRFGSADRRRQIDERIRSIERYESLLAAVAATGDRGKPHEGLEMIEGVEVPAEYRERLDQLKTSLSEQLERLDRQPPVVELATEDPEYRRNEPVVLEFQVTDDYEVLDFSVRARRANQDEYLEVDVEALGDGRYRAELSPSFHDNKAILFWAQARDRLGNVTRFAGPESPVELKRRRFWRR